MVPKGKSPRYSRMERLMLMIMRNHSITFKPRQDIVMRVHLEGGLNDSYSVPYARTA